MLPTANGLNRLNEFSRAHRLHQKTSAHFWSKTSWSTNCRVGFPGKPNLLRTLLDDSRGSERLAFLNMVTTDRLEYSQTQQACTRVLKWPVFGQGKLRYLHESTEHAFSHEIFFCSKKEKERSETKKRTKEEDMEKEVRRSGRREGKNWKKKRRIRLRCYHPWLSFLRMRCCRRFKSGYAALSFLFFFCHDVSTRILS